jgi:protein O-mannosyl-transferase
MRRPGILGRISLALPLAVLAAYWPALRGGLLWDDDAHVTRLDLRTLAGLWGIWTRPGATQQYYPVLHSAFWIEHALWGDSTLPYHLLNCALHAATCVLLYCVLRRLSVPGAVLAAFAFALHPVCAESVAWISEQKNTLSGAFYMAAALAYLRFDEDRRRQWYVVATGLFVLALLSKSVTSTLPAALLVLFWWKRGTLSARRDVVPLVPWFVLGALAGAVTAWMERTYIGANGSAFALSLGARVLVAGRAAWFYLGKILWPADLISIYPRWVVDGAVPWQYAFPLMAALALAVLFAVRKTARGPLAAGLLFVGTLFPALGFINVYPFVFSYVADHFQYLAAAGMISSLAAGLTLAGIRYPQAAWPLQATGICIVIFLGTLTCLQSGKYRDQESFYTAILSRNPEAWLAHDNLGIVLNQQGKTEEAADHFKEAMRLNTSYPEAFNNYGNQLARSGRWTEAANAYAGALRARPSFAAAEYNWGYALGQAGRYPEAVAHYRNALHLKPDFAEAHCELGNALGNTGQVPEAMAEYHEALKLRPEYPEANANLGLALAQEGQWDDAVASIRKALRARPDYAEAHGYLGYALAGTGRYAEAVLEYKEALRVGPNNPDIHYNMGLALGQMGRTAEAQAQIEEARQIQLAAARR